MFCFAQNSYEEAIQLSDKATRNKEYGKAIQFFFVAETFDPDKKLELRKRTETIVNLLETHLKQNIELIQKARNEERKAKREKQQIIIDNDKVMRDNVLSTSQYLLTIKENEEIYLQETNELKCRINELEKKEIYPINCKEIIIREIIDFENSKKNYDKNSASQEESDNHKKQKIKYDLNIKKVSEQEIKEYKIKEARTGKQKVKATVIYE
jgi:hypothetical protein